MLHTWCIRYRGGEWTLLTTTLLVIRQEAVGLGGKHFSASEETLFLNVGLYDFNCCTPYSYKSIK